MIKKETKGEDFQDLHMINALSAKKIKAKKPIKPKIEVLNSNTLSESEENNEKKLENDFQNLKICSGYGFDRRYTDVFDNLEEETIELFEVNPDFLLRFGLKLIQKKEKK